MASQVRGMLPLLAAIVLLVSAPSMLSSAFLACWRAGSSSGLAMRGSVGLAASGRGNKHGYIGPEDDLDFEDDDLDGYDLSGDKYEDYDDLEEGFREPPEQVLDEWAQDPFANEVLESFQGEKEEGTKTLSFRSVYKLLEVVGLDRMEFIAGFGAEGYDDNYDGEDSGGENFGGKAASSKGQRERAGYQERRR